MIDQTAAENRVIVGDARRMSEVDDAAVELVVTSPPYWQLKDYGDAGQIGFHDDYETYIDHLNLVWMECARVLHPGCRLCVNIGDQFARAAYYGRYKVIPIRTEIIRCIETLGLDYMGAVIWRKVTTCNTSGGATIMGSFPYPRNGIVKLDYEFILIFRKPGKAPPPSEEAKEAARLTTEEWNRYFAGHWEFPGARSGEHLAAFPVELPHRLIRMFTFPGETVLDPFLGSGTTAVAARRLGRRSIGYEINPEFLPTIRQRLADELAWEIDVVEQPPVTPDLDRLPYRYRDPLKVVRKVDPRGQQYGSKMTDADRRAKKTPPVRLAAILAPDRVRLSDGRDVRLLGIVPRPDRADEAMAFLRDTAKRQGLLVETDPDAAPDEVYLLLKNRTNLNAYLLKRGLAAADTARPYRMRARFERYARGDSD